MSTETSVTVPELESVLEQVRSAAEHAGKLVIPIVEAAQQSVAITNPALVWSNSELKETWPLTQELPLREALKQHFLGRVSRSAPKERAEIKETAPLPFFTGTQRYFAIGDFYPYEGKVEGQNHLDDENIPEVATQYLHDLSSWTDAMSAKGHDLLVSARLPEAGSAVAIDIYSDMPSSQDYFAYRLGETNDTFKRDMYYPTGWEDVRVGQRVIASAVQNNIQNDLRSTFA